jgi:hypothetical protein
MAQTANITGYTIGWTDPFLLQHDWSRELFFEKSGIEHVEIAAIASKNVIQSFEIF